MSMENNQDVRLALAQVEPTEETLKARVRAIVLQAVLHRGADPKALREIIESAMAGLGEGLLRRGAQASQALREAVTCLDEAIGKAVYALQLALEEAWDEGRQIASEDLKQAIDAVQGLEGDLLRTLRQAATSAQDGVRDEVARLLEHFERTGTDTGARVRAVLELLKSRLGSAADGVGADVQETARTAAARLAEVAAGLLHGLADAIERRQS